MADSLSEKTLTLNPDEINDICNSYKEKVNTLGVNDINITSDFSQLINANLFPTYFTSLKEYFDKVKTSITTICGALENFASDQRTIDDIYAQSDDGVTGTPNTGDYTGTNGTSNGQYSSDGYSSHSSNDKDTPSDDDKKEDNKLKTEVDNESLEKLLNNTDFMKSLLGVLNTSNTLLTDSSKSEYLKQLLLLKNFSNEEVTKILNSFSSEAIRVALLKLVNGEIKFDNAQNLDLLEDIQKIVLGSINRGQMETTLDTTTLLEGKYNKGNYTSTKGVNVEFYAYIPDNADSTNNLPIHIYLSSNEDANNFNNTSLTSYLNNGEKASGIVICPKLGNGNDYYSKEYLEAVKELTDSLTKKYNCDSSRISVSGSGAGAQASMNIATLYPDYFSKVVCVDNQNAVTGPSSMVDGDKNKAVTNLSKNNILELTTKDNSESNTYSATFYDELKEYGNIDYKYIDDNSNNESVYKNEFTYNGKTYTNLLEYCMSVLKA